MQPKSELKKLMHLGPRVELSCTLRSFPSFAAIEIWSPDQTRTTVPSNDRVAPLAVSDSDLPMADGVVAFACRQRRFCFSARSAARRLPAPPYGANITDGHSTQSPSP